MKAVFSSLAEFFMAGLLPRTPLAKAIAFALAVKLVIIVSMKVFLFSGDARPTVDEATMLHVIGPSSSLGTRIQKSNESQTLASARLPAG